MKTRLIALFIAAALSAGAAQAKDPATPAKPETAEQKAAQAEIDKLIERIKVLSTQLGEDSDVRVIVRKDKRVGGPGHDGHDRMMWHEGEGHGDGQRRIRIETIEGDAGKPRVMHGDGGGDDVVIERIRTAPEAFRRGPGLGIVMAPNPAAAGVRIAAVSPESPAQKAGLRADDVLLSVDGKTISGSGAAAVESARKLLGNLKQDQVVKLRYARQGKTHDASVKAGEIGRVFAFERGAGMPRAHHGEGRMHERMRMLPPGMEMEIERIGPMRECAKGEEDCGLPVLYQAFRWQGLNLASLDAGLGRYFGADTGVLVLSAGPELKGLQSGDVIRGVAGAPVKSPRDVMRALRDKDAGAQLKLDVLRDRKATAVTVTVPESRPLPFMEAPLPPTAPRALPRTPTPAAPGAPAAAPPAPPAPPRAGGAI
jgi:hypothetical protein